MQLFGRTPRFNFMAYRRAATVGSSVAIAISLLSIALRGLNLGMDFTGGLLVEVRYENAVDLGAVRSVLVDAGFVNPQVQNFGSASDVLIRLPPEGDSVDANALQDRIVEALRAQDASAAVQRTEFVGPQVGRDLTEQGSLAMLFALLMIFVYVMMRFRWKLAVGAIVALIHDVIITVGFFSVSWLSFDLTVLGSVLAVIGYSLNDTIVVFDRVRENFRHIRRGSAETIMNASINQTLARTLVTGMTTLLVLLALLFIAGETLVGFSMALIVGIIVGTYSSVYVASAAALALNVVPTDLMPPEVEREKVDELP